MFCFKSLKYYSTGVNVTNPISKQVILFAQKRRKRNKNLHKLHWS